MPKIWIVACPSRIRSAPDMGSGELGYHVGATQEITSSGLVGIRYDHYDPDQDAREQQAVRVVPFNPELRHAQALPRYAPI